MTNAGFEASILLLRIEEFACLSLACVSVVYIGVDRAVCGKVSESIGRAVMGNLDAGLMRLWPCEALYEKYRKWRHEFDRQVPETGWVCGDHLACVWFQCTDNNGDRQWLQSYRASS